MIIGYLLCTIAGFTISQLGVFDRLLDKFKFYHEDEERNIISAPESKAVISPTTRQVTIWKKHKRGDIDKIKLMYTWEYNEKGNLVKVPVSGKVLENNAERLNCDMVMLEDGILHCMLQNDGGEEMYSIKDIDRFII